MKVGHQNLCDYAEDERSLYKLWDDDLKKYMRRRQWYEAIGFALLVGASVMWRSGQVDAAIACALFGIMLLFAAIKFMIDESNINYLIHQWDLRNAIEEFRRAQQRTL
jgi:hypothetical protein